MTLSDCEVSELCCVTFGLWEETKEQSTVINPASWNTSRLEKLQIKSWDAVHYKLLNIKKVPIFTLSPVSHTHTHSHTCTSIFSEDTCWLKHSSPLPLTFTTTNKRLNHNITLISSSNTQTAFSIHEDRLRCPLSKRWDKSSRRQKYKYTHKRTHFLFAEKQNN